jgi:adenylate kinase family enzyme
MNVVEAYIKFKKQLVILISGFNGSGKGKLAQHISKDLKIDIVNTSQYYKDGYDIRVKLADGSEVVDWDSIDAIDWAKLNEYVNENKNKGVILVGFAFPVEVLKFETDFHLHVKINKQNLLENRHTYLEENKEKYSKLYELKGKPIELMILNQITYPHYLKYLESSKIDRFLNSNDESIEKLYDITFDYMIEKIQQYLNSLNQLNLQEQKHQVTVKEQSVRPEQKKKNPVTFGTLTTKDLALLKKFKNAKSALDLVEIEYYDPNEESSMTPTESTNMSIDSTEKEYIGTSQIIKY